MTTLFWDQSLAVKIVVRFRKKKVAEVSLQNSYACFKRGLQRKLVYPSLSNLNAQKDLANQENNVQMILLPSYID